MCEAAPWIGKGRAQVIAINVLVPFAAAAGVREAQSLFARLPGEPSNRVVRYMAAQLSGGAELRFRGACQQQGLLQLFKVTCAARVCERCPARAHTRPTRARGEHTRSLAGTKMPGLLATSPGNQASKRWV